MLEELNRLFGMDERFIMHRYRSSRLALAVGLIGTVLWFSFELIANDHPRWDLLAIAGAMALAKIGAIVYYRVTG